MYKQSVLGAGYASVVVTLITSCYYYILMAYVVFFFVQSFTLGALPWASCDNYWNTPDCLDYNNQTLLNMYNDYLVFKETNNQSHEGAQHVNLFNRTIL